MKILFICTGNYYRSRFAEYVFNYISSQKQLDATAFSRGLALGHPDNVGNLSPHVKAYLRKLDLGKLEDRQPVAARAQDLVDADRIIVLDEKEHRPMIAALFPAFENKVEYWQFQDEYLIEPSKMLPLLEQKILALIDEITGH